MLAAHAALQAISGKVDGYNMADLRVLLDRAALSAARRAIHHKSAVGRPSGRELSRPLSNGYVEPPDGPLPLSAGAFVHRNCGFVLPRSGRSACSVSFSQTKGVHAHSKQKGTHDWRPTLRTVERS